MNMMSEKEYEKYTAFMNNKRGWIRERTPEQKERFYEQVKNRVVAFLEATGCHELSSMLAGLFWGTRTEYDETIALSQAESFGYILDGTTINDSPYFWYCLLKPHARKLAEDAKAFTRHFEK